MRGFTYRLAVSIKELGERIKCRFLIVIGLALREHVINGKI